MRIAILGYGTVGKGVYDIITENNLSYIEIIKILRKMGSKKDLPIITDNFNDIINDDSIDTIVECLGGLDPAYKYVKEALLRGKNVVSSNKLLIATHYDELLKLSYDKNVYLLFEASVGGGVPWLENLSRIADIDKVTGFKGIINATVNFILYKMTTESIEFDDVLKEAQRLGYAEQDPSSDIDGDDVLYKTIISANVASRKSFAMDNVLKFGIRFLTKEDIDFFKENKLVVKLISEYDANLNTIMVMPELFKLDKAIAHVVLNNNYMDIYCKTEGKLSLEGQGAGRYPTAHSVVQDLVHIHDKYKKMPLTLEKVYVDYKDFSNRFYIKKKGEKGKFIDGITISELRDKDILFLAKVNE